MVDGLWQGTSSEQARYPARQGRIWQAFLNFRPWARSRLHSRMAKHVNLSTMATRSHSSVGVSAVVSCQSDLALAWDASRPPSSASVRNASRLKKCPAKRSKIRANKTEGLN